MTMKNDNNVQQYILGNIYCNPLLTIVTMTTKYVATIL